MNTTTPVKNRLKKYLLESKSLAISFGLLGSSQTVDSSIVELNLGALTNATFNTSGTGTYGSGNATYLIDLSNDIGDAFYFRGSDFNGGALHGSDVNNGASLAYNVISGYFTSLAYFPIGSIVGNMIGDAGRGYIVQAGILLGDWTVDRPNGALGFRTGDNTFGFFRVDWKVATETLTFLSGALQTDGSPIAVTDIPETKYYSLILSLGSIGLNYYRKIFGYQK